MMSEYDDADFMRYVQRDLWAGAVILRGALPTFPSVPALPTPGVEWRAKTAVVLGGAGTEDTVYVALKSAAGTYSWVVVASG